MKNFTAILAIVALGAVSTVQSQTPKPVTRSVVSVLKKMSEDNEALLKRQAESLKQLEEMEKTAKAVKNFASRS